MPRGYTTSAQVAAYLGATFDATQTAACDDLIEALEAHLDRTLRYRWLAPAGPVLHAGPLYGPTLSLVWAPLQAVSSVTVRAAPVGSTVYPLVAGTDYAVLDASEAILRVERGWDGGYPPRDVVTDQPFLTGDKDASHVEVSYTQPTGQAPPPDVTLASTQSVAAWMAPLLPSSQLGGTGAGGTAAALGAGIKSFQVGQELRVEYAQPSTSSSGGGGVAAVQAVAPLPAAAVALLVPYGYPTGSGPVYA